MQAGDLLRFHNEGLAIVVKGTYHKRVWGSSGHPEDIRIVSMVDIMHLHNGHKQSKTLAFVNSHCKIVSKAKKD